MIWKDFSHIYCHKPIPLGNRHNHQPEGMGVMIKFRLKLPIHRLYQIVNNTSFHTNTSSLLSFIPVSFILHHHIQLGLQEVTLCGL
jgi:hypothetical protein